MRAVTLLLLTIAVFGCGREPSRLLRQGQLPIYDFPLYLTEGVSGRLWKIDRDRSKTLVAEGLSDPRGVATDRFQNVYVVEYGSGRLVRFLGGKGEAEVVRDGLLAPSVVAVDSFGEVFVAQDGARNVARMGDGKEFAAYATVPTALAFGVGDQPIVGLYGENRVLWGWDAAGAGADVGSPVNASVDGTGRVYVAEGDPNDGRVMRYHQREPEGETVVANGLTGPLGIAVDLVGNVFVVEQGASRIVLISFDGQRLRRRAGREPHRADQLRRQQVRLAYRCRRSAVPGVHPVLTH